VGPNSFRYLARYIPALFSGNEMRLRLRPDPTQQSFLARNWSGDDATAFETHRVLNLNPSSKALSIMRKNLYKRIPEFEGIEFAETWAGVIDAMPDIVPVMDKIETVPGLFLATGFSGHGFGIGPGAGKVMAKMVAGDQPEHDLSRFRFGRFTDGSKMKPGPAL
jgi:glycine/D-amino acid oxidase-like deaminating enzyme